MCVALLTTKARNNTGAGKDTRCLSGSNSNLSCARLKNRDGSSYRHYNRKSMRAAFKAPTTLLEGLKLIVFSTATSTDHKVQMFSRSSSRTAISENTALYNKARPSKSVGKTKPDACFG